VVPNERDFRGSADPTFLTGMLQGDPDQSRAARCHVCKRAKPEKFSQARMLHLLPSDPCQVSGDEAGWNAAALETAEQGPNSRAHFAFEVRAGSCVNVLRVPDDFRHSFPDDCAGGAGVPKHGGQDVTVKHTLRGDLVEGGFDPGNPIYSRDKSFAVMGAGFADESSIYIEKDKGIGREHSSLIYLHGD
jgi:hypothetical protein